MQFNIKTLVYMYIDTYIHMCACASCSGGSVRARAWRRAPSGRAAAEHQNLHMNCVYYIYIYIYICISMLYQNTMDIIRAYCFPKNTRTIKHPSIDSRNRACLGSSLMYDAAVNKTIDQTNSMLIDQICADFF